jgi:REP element-mobilizing transposase RayT
MGGAVQTDQPSALLITWSCYGTWLPGDRRGFDSNMLNPKGHFERKHNVPGTPLTADDRYTRTIAENRQRGATVWLSRSLASTAAKGLIEAASTRQWRILRGAVMANHIHVVVFDCPDNGPLVRRILKGVSQRAMSLAVGQSRRWWTQGGSDRYLHGHLAIEAAIRYVANQEGMLAAIRDGQVVAEDLRGPR